MADPLDVVELLSICRQERDPFWEPFNAEVQIGSAQIYLQSLAYMVSYVSRTNI